MLAMALIVVMPAISRVMPMTMTMSSMPGMDAPCPVHDHQASTKHPDSPSAPADPMARCGYCVLLSHTPILASSIIIHVVPAAPDVATPTIALPGDRSEAPLLSADPRGPPLSFS
jgi:hypothetical protein